jgi:hypothetical protein
LVVAIDTTMPVSASVALKGHDLVALGRRRVVRHEVVVVHRDAVRAQLRQRRTMSLGSSRARVAPPN